MASAKREYVELCALKGRIREMKKSYRKLAPELGMAPATLCNKLNGLAAFDCPEMVKLAEALEIDPKEVADFFMPGYCVSH